ncbi:MAG: flagellar motor protein MotA [Conexibacter sp.]|nr:flagellar motor protein MotA [Conexibacter sp.]
MESNGVKRWRSFRALGVGAVVGVLAVGVAACGSSDDGSGGSSGGSATAASADKPNGSSIKIMIQAPIKGQGLNNDGIPNAINVGKAYETYINHKGGINGRPLQIETCDDHQVTQDSVNCARQAIKDGVVAAVGGTSYFAPNVVPVYEKGHTAWFGAACNLAVDEFTSPVSFPTATCSLSTIEGVVAGLAMQGCKKIAFTNYALDIGKFQAMIVNNAGKSLGVGGVTTVTLPQLSVPDITPYVARATDGRDCLFAGSLTNPTSFQQWMTTWKQQGKKQKLGFNAGVVGPDQLSAFAPELEGAVIANTASDISLPIWNDYRDATKAAGVPNGDNGRAQVTWASLVAFTKIVQGMKGTIDHATFIEAANKASDLKMDGLQADLDLTQEFTGLGGKYPRMFNRKIGLSVVKDGKIGAYENGRFFDMTNLLDGKPFDPKA